MELWLDQIRENNLFRMASPASQEEIEAAENKLGLTFASEYKEFLSSVGACVCFQHEIKGITDNVTLNVVSATEEARKELDMIPHAWYVIEDTHILLYLNDHIKHIGQQMILYYHEIQSLLFIDQKEDSHLVDSVRDRQDCDMEERYMLDTLKSSNYIEYCY